MNASASAAAPGTPTARVRAVLCTRGGLYGAVVLRRLGRCKGIELCGIVRSERILDTRFGFLRGAHALIRRCGIAYAFYLWCATTLADCLTGEPALRPSMPLHTTRDINSQAGLQFLLRCSPDLLVSAFFDQRLGAAALAVPTLGCVNIHPSLLPEFRGVDPVLQACLARVDSLGVTVHWMTPALDEGSILAQQTVAVPARASLFQMTMALFAEGAELLTTNLDRIARHEAGASQRSRGSYQSWPSRPEVRAFHALGTPLIRLSDLRRSWIDQT